MTAVFNHRLVVERRRQQDITIAALARTLGTTSGVLFRIERGGGVEEQTTAFLRRYAKALGVKLTDLFEESQPDPGALEHSGDDIQKVMGALVAAPLAVHVDLLSASFGWDTERVRLALDDATVIAPLVGLSVIWHGDSIVTVKPAASTPSLSRQALERDLRTNGLDVGSARIIYDLTAERKVRESKDPVVLAYLASVGMVTTADASAQGPTGPKRGASMKLADISRFDLCLDDA